MRKKKSCKYKRAHYFSFFLTLRNKKEKKKFNKQKRYKIIIITLNYSPYFYLYKDIIIK